MTSSKQHKFTPRLSVDAECRRRGSDAVIDGCIALLAGEMVDDELIFALGGGPARWAVEGGEPGPDYWIRVWAARGLMWAWDDRAAPTIRAALHDDAWRVREMAVKVAARHGLKALLPAMRPLRDDVNARVRAAADRGVDRLTT